MTLSDFKAAHIYPLESPILGTEYMKFNLLYNIYGTVARIDAISIRVSTDNLTQLQHATSITFKAPAAGDFLTVPLDDANVQVDIEQVGNYYIYAIAPNPLDQALRPAIATPVGNFESYYTDLIINPTVEASNFDTDPYNVLLNSSAVDRTSNYRVVSDRIQNTIHPANLQNILNDIAKPAPVQDSSYYSTGWVRGRYEGTKITTTNNSGIDPIIQGTFFQGALFSTTVSDSYILGLTDSEITYLPYISAGRLAEPRYTVEPVGLRPEVTIESTYDYATFKEIVPGSSILPLAVGDLLIISSSGTSFNSEIMQMLEPSTDRYYPYQEIYQDIYSDNIYTIHLKRGYNATTPQAASTSTKLYRIVPTRIYNILTTGTGTVQAGKLKIQGVDEILYIDLGGLVVSGSTRYIE